MKFFTTLVLVSIIALSLSMCKKDSNPDPDPKPTPDKRTMLLNKWWYTKDGLGDYKFKTGNTYEYKTPWGTDFTGTWQWYPGVIDSMQVTQDGGGQWTIWFREILEHQFKMSQGNEFHLNIYTFKDTKTK